MQIRTFAGVEEVAYRTREVVTGLKLVTAKLGEMVGRAGWRADDINGALSTLLVRAERATEALEPVIALKAERAATLRYNIIDCTAFSSSLANSGRSRVRDHRRNEPN